MAKDTKTKLLDKTLWFSRRETFDIDYFEMLRPRREVSYNPRYKSGVYYSEKCRREIQYESALELEFAKRLEKDNEVLFYWDQPVSVRYRRGKIVRPYTPDFGIYLRSGGFVLAEVKDLPSMIDHRVQAKAEGLMDFCSRRGFGLLLTDGRNTPEKLLEGGVNIPLEEEIERALQAGTLRKRESSRIMERCHATSAQLYKAIIRLDLKFKPFPFKLERGNQSPVYRQVYFHGMDYDALTQTDIADRIG